MIYLVICNLVLTGALALAVVHIYTRQRALENYTRGIGGYLAGAASALASELQTFKRMIIAGGVLGALSVFLRKDNDNQNPQP